ncbi:hypothetical protein [Francisella-like endosymbiont]|uniref:hypothetical protein n=1 Tax=Francisella-like endosymbiont TaxID=512373 RepID=UPI003CD01425
MPSKIISVSGVGYDLVGSYVGVPDGCEPLLLLLEPSGRIIVKAGLLVVKSKSSKIETHPGVINIPFSHNDLIT